MFNNLNFDTKFPKKLIVFSISGIFVKLVQFEGI